ncbi:DUF2752 domain-containing protein [Candidatus Ulvibacter alkanivorans]|uniref:DUF2752 domain-containing protein n=1 Tax=Candidatus Ulvibacter alkanivorans TaxID=2267620 RepID=UPI002936DB17|nr:DUF2752 domain-containing protein [Candidatus Ulvibacter alkanivorans]
MLPCLNKKLLGFECLGCGIQRATALFFRGEFFAAFKMYPALYTLLLLAGFLIINMFIKIKYSEKIKILLVVLNIAIILGNFIIKQFN